MLEKVSSIIITEGKNDYYTLKYFKEMYFPSKFKELNFYPGGGANSNFQVMRLYLAWSRSFIILLDADKHGLKSKREYEKEFNLEVQDKIFTYADVDDYLKGKATEDIFLEDEKLLITQLLDNNATKYEKSKFNTSIQNLLFQKNKIDLSASTVNKFESILSFLQSKLK